MVPMGLRARQQQRRRHREQTVDTVGEGECGTDWERSPETSALPYVKWIAGGFALWRREPQPGALWHAAGGRRFTREAVCVHLGLIHAGVWQKPTQYCKAIIFQLKNKFKKAARESSFVLFPMRRHSRTVVCELGSGFSSDAGFASIWILDFLALEPWEIHLLVNHLVSGILSQQPEQAQMTAHHRGFLMLSQWLQKNRTQHHQPSPARSVPGLS